MSNNGNPTKHIIYISRRMHFVRNGQKWHMNKKLWYEGGLQLEEIATKNVREDELNPGLWYDMVRIDNWQNTCKEGW